MPAIPLTPTDKDLLAASLRALYYDKAETANEMERAWGWEDARVQAAWKHARDVQQLLRTLSTKLGVAF